MLATLCYTPKLFWDLCCRQWSASSVPRVPTPGPYNATRDVRRCPTWQGQCTRTSPTWGYHLCKSEMSTCAVRDLETTRVVLVLLRAIPATTCSDLLWARCMTPTQYSCQGSGWSEWAEKVHCCRNKGMSRRGGWSTHVTTPVVWQSVAPLRQNSCSKSSLGAHPRMLLYLRRINGKSATHTLALH